MRLYRRNGIYYVELVDLQGRRHRVSTKQTIRARAEIIGRRLYEQVADPTRSAADKTTLLSALNRAIEERKRRGRAQGTLDMYRTKSGHLVRVLGAQTPMSSLTAAVLDDYVSQRHNEGAQEATIHKELTVLRVALQHAKRRGEYPFDVGSVLPRVRSGSPPRQRVLPIELENAFLEALSKKARIFCLLALGTGARRAELLKIQPNDINLEQMTVLIRGTKTSLANRTVPILPMTLGYLREAKGETQGVTAILGVLGNVQHSIKKAALKVGLDGLSPNDLRRTFATRLRQQGVPPYLIAGVLGHADSRMVERVYGRLDLVGLKAALMPYFSAK